MKKTSISTVPFALLLCSGVSSFAYADDQREKIENDDDKVMLDSMVISADEIVDQPFQKTTLIKENLGMSGDGADLLKKEAGISVIRQGGAASDPLLRGLGGTRLNISLDGVPFGGVCNHRMDPATAYVKPGTFNSFSLLKGPQSVRYGNSIVGSVNFDRAPIIYEELGFRADSSYFYGSFNRQDLTVNASTGFKQGYVSYTHNNSRSGNYENGNGEVINLTFTDTANDRLALGYRPDDDTLLEISGVLSEGKMGNATIHMDVTRLDRQNYDAHFKKENINSWLRSIDVRYNFTKVDHAMDDFSLRQQPVFHRTFVVMGQYWEKHFAKVESMIDVVEDVELLIGMDYKNERYDANAKGGRKGIHPIPADISKEQKNHILDFDNFAAYAELSYQQTQNLRWVAGLRGDTLGTDTGLMHAAGEVSRKVLSGANQHRRQTLMAGFLRGEYAFEDLPLQLSAGYGHAERAADYWEVYSFDGFALDAEENNEFDVELTYDNEGLVVKASAFYSHISDFILVRGIGGGVGGTNNAAANINAQRFGGELNMAYQLNDYLTVLGDVSYTHGENLTQDVALAQTPPLEGNIGLRYQQGDFSGLISTRLVNSQSRIHKGYGNTLAIDSTTTPGFVTASLELGYKPHPMVNVKFGIDNLFNKNYAEHISRNSSISISKIEEPGRAIWGRISIDFDYPESFLKN